MIDEGEELEDQPKAQSCSSVPSPAKKNCGNSAVILGEEGELEQL